MSIISFSFLFFVIILSLFYLIIPKKCQWILLLAGNLVFYAYSGYQYLIYLLSCTFFTWYAAIQIDKYSLALKSGLTRAADKEEKDALRRTFGKKKNLWITAALFLTLGVWIVLKYGSFLLDSFASVFHLPEFQGVLQFIVPLGMSFYTFDAIGYMIDVSRGKYRAEKNFSRFLTFISYFPHIVQGPFSRFDALGKTLFVGHRFSFNRLSEGFGRILWGYFKKLLIADKLALTVNEIFANHTGYGGVHILFVIFLYAVQLYADFSGYIDIISGISHILGIELEMNFRQPFFSVSIEDFWRRWHMTLGHWFRDYLFYPISRSERSRKIRNRFPPHIAKHMISFIAMFWVWSASGLWHGANWTFLVWGWLNMMIMWVSQILDPVYRKSRDIFHISLENKIWHGFRIVRTFCITCFLFFLTRADSLSHAGKMLGQINLFSAQRAVQNVYSLFPGLDENIVWVAAAAVLLMLLIDILSETGKWDPIKKHTPFLVKDFVFVLLIVALILFGGNGEDVAKGFIYANF